MDPAQTARTGGEERAGAKHPGGVFFIGYRKRQGRPLRGGNPFPRRSLPSPAPGARRIIYRRPPEPYPTASSLRKQIQYIKFTEEMQRSSPARFGGAPPRRTNQMPISALTCLKHSTAKSRSSRVCPADTWVRIRALPWGTTG